MSKHQKFENIVKHARLWDAYARLAPIVALITAGVAWYVSHDFVSTIISTGITVAITTIIVWWFWAVYSIANIAVWRRDLEKSTDAIQKLLTENKVELQDIKKEFKDESQRSI